MTEGEEVFFAVRVNGQSQPTLIWYCDGKEIQSDYSQEIKEDGSLSLHWPRILPVVLRKK